MTRTASFKIAARKSILCAAAVFGLAAFAAPASAQDCNPFTVLFGGCAQARVAPALPAYEPMNTAPQAKGALKPVQHAKKPVDAASHRKAHKPVAKQAEARKAPKAEAPAGSLAAFAADPTLRAGDIVVTTGGFRVFRNNKFTAIAQDGGALAQLEKASMQPRTAAIEETISETRGLVALRRAIRVASSQ